jgi:hypothetical protein
MSQGGFLSFHTLISTTFIKVIYIVGMMVITIGGLAAMIMPFVWHAQYPGSSPDAAFIQAVGGLLTVIIGNLLWRVLCEGFILLFSIHELLGAVLRQMQEVDSGQSPFIFEQLRATEANNEQRHDELLKALHRLRP